MLEALGVKVCELVTITAITVSIMSGVSCTIGSMSTILVKTGLNWVKDAIDDHYSELGKPST